MIEQVDERLKEWASSVLPDVEVSLGPPSAPPGRGVNLYLFELLHHPPARAAARTPLQIFLRYLVTTWADDPEGEHTLLGNLVFAAMENSEFEVEFDSFPARVWTAFGLPPRPSVVLKVPLRRERPEPAAKLVRVPLVVRHSLMRPLYGFVLGPEDVPIAGARIELPALQLSTRTNSKGRFDFPAVPAEPKVTLLLVKAKGKVLSVNPAEIAAEGKPLLIRFQLMEV